MATTTSTVSSASALAGSGTLSSAGLGSGLDVNGIVTKLMSLERQPIDRIDTKTGIVQAEITAYGSLKGALSTFQTSIQSLSSATTYSATKATVADTTQFSVSSDSTAGVGNYSIQVQKLAKAEKLQSVAFSKATDSVGTGSLTFNFGTYSTDSNGITSFTTNTNKKEVTVTIPSGSDSLTAIAAAINNAKAGISATVLNDGTSSYLSFSPTDPGTANSLKISVSDDDTNNSDASGLSRLAFDKSTGDMSGSVSFIAPNAVTISEAAKNNKFTLTVDGGTTKTLTLPDGTYDAANIVAAMQTVVDAEIGAGKATVSLNGSNQLAIASTAPASAISAVPGNTGQAALFGISLAAPNAVAISAASSNNQFQLALNDGTAQTVTLADGTYDAVNIVSAMQTAVDNAFGAGNATVSLSGNQLLITSNIAATTTLSATPGNTGQAELFGVDLSTPVNVAAASTNNQFELAINNGTAQTVTLPDGSYDTSNIVAAMQSAVDTTFGAGKATVSLNGSNQLVITSSTAPSAVTSLTPGNTGETSLFGVSLAAPNAVSISALSSNNQFKVALDNGTATTITIPDGTYDATNIVSVMQTAVDTAFGGPGKATVSLDGSNQLVITSNTVPSATLGTETGYTGQTALFGVTLTAPNAVTVTASNNQFMLALDGGAATTVTMPNGSYDAVNIVSAMQSAVDSAMGAGKAVVSLDANKQLVIASKTTTGLASATLSGVTGNTGLDAFFGSSGTAVSSSSRMTESVVAQDAVLIIDGITVTKSANTITDAIQGVTLNLTATATTATTLTIKSDSSALSTAIDGLVKNYNTLSTMFKEVLSYDATTGKTGALQGEGTVRSIQSQISALMQSVTRGTGLSSISELGVSFQRDGTLKFNSDKLQTVLSDPTKNVKSFFMSTDGSSGLASKMNTALYSILNTGGTLTSRTEGLNQSLTNYAKQRAALETRMTSIEARYRKQYSNLDTLIANMNKTSSYLTTQLANLPGVSSSSA